MLHHLEHRHHQEDDVDLSKHTQITVLQAALKRASGFPSPLRQRPGNSQMGREKKEKREKRTKKKNSILESQSEDKVHPTELERAFKKQRSPETRNKDK